MENLNFLFSEAAKMLFNYGNECSVLPYVVNQVRQLAESSLIIISPTECNEDQGHPEQDIKPLVEIASSKHCVVHVED